jgi:sterol desaturase/sphingolipid hydroxylase (fatty acid hydroxylase superfamily)
MPVRTVVLVVFGLGVLYFERRRALRRRVEPDAVHGARNLVIAGLAAVTAQLVEGPAVMRVARSLERRRGGVVARLPGPPWVRDLAAILLMDYTLYIWHVLVHRVPWLWRLHLVHHVDLDMDASTGIRFHFAEIAASIPWRAAQIAVIGTSPRALGWWQTLTLGAVIFHHSNAALPVTWERRLARVIVTPRMHGIHHSVVQAVADANYSSGLALWDWLHRTIQLNVPQHSITVGIPAYQDPAELGAAAVLTLPLVHDRDTWRYVDGTAPSPAGAGPRGTLQV